MDENEVAREIGLGFLLSLFFALLRWVQDFLSPDRPQFKWWVGLIKGLTGGGVGMLTTLLCLRWNLDIFLSGFLIGLSGWGGVETLDVFKEMAYDAIRRKLNATRPPEDTTDSQPKV